MGNGLVAASVSPSGGIHSIITYDRELGIIELTAHPPFDDARRYDQRAVRAYRATMAAPDAPWFGLRVALDGHWRAGISADGAPYGELETNDVRVRVTTLAPAGRRALLQVWRLEARRTCAIRWEWKDVADIRRPSYPQLTEGGPLGPLTGLARGWYSAFTDPPDAIDLGGTVRLAPGEVRELRIAVGLGEGAEQDVGSAIDDPVGTTPVDRALAYARICALRTENEAVCILADHRILPLSWNRDAYYVATLFRERGEHELVRAHLRWLFEVAQRSGGLWGRAHLANGRVKDRAFQLDQQCYPLLEAAEAGAAQEYRAEIEATLQALERHRQGELYATEETPADDRLALPFHFSSHVLLWHTLAALGRARFDVDAERVRQTTLAAFEDGGRFAYATDSRGSFRHYHDANDLPTALAPAWGFCSADDPRWRATVTFAWSESNEAYYSGPLGGLGSVHTPHPWPLGDLQEIIVARAIGDSTRELRAREKLERVSTWDGLLPEAYDQVSGAVRSRHWFAWPIALRASRGG